MRRTGSHSITPTKAFSMAFVRASLYALPMALLFVLIEDYGAAQGRGPESGSTELLAPIVAMILLVSAIFVAALAGALGGAAAVVSRFLGQPYAGYLLAMLGGVIAHQARGQPGLKPWLEVLLILTVPAALAVWHGRSKST